MEEKSKNNIAYLLAFTSDGKGGIMLLKRSDKYAYY